MLELYGEMSEMLIAGNIEEIEKLSHQAMEGGAQAQHILEKGLLAGMDIVSQRFKACEMYIPEVLRSAKAMHAGMDILKPFLSESDLAGAGTVLIGTVEGDLHDIGKNLVGMMLEGAGFKVVDLGTNVNPRAFVDAAAQHEPHILGMSALLTTTMPKMGETIIALREAGIRDQIKVMIGGAPVTQEFADEIGVDAYGSNATAAVDKAKHLVEKREPLRRIL